VYLTLREIQYQETKSRV